MSSFVTGDIQNNVEKLRRSLKSIQYAGMFDIPGIVSGETETYLPLLDYITMGFSRNVAKYIVNKGYGFYTSTDIKFIKGVFRFIRTEFHYNPCLQPSQFLSKGFAERKAIFLCKLILHMKKKHNELVKELRKKKRKRKVNAPSPRLEILAGGSKPLKEKPSIKVKKHQRETTKVYDDDPNTYDNDPTYFEDNSSPSPIRSSSASINNHQHQHHYTSSSSFPYSQKEIIVNEIAKMKKDIIDTFSLQLSDFKNEIEVRMRMMEGKIKFLEKSYRSNKENDMNLRTERIIEDAEFEMKKADAYSIRMPSDVDEQTNTKDFISKIRQRNEETLEDINIE